MSHGPSAQSTGKSRVTTRCCRSALGRKRWMRSSQETSTAPSPSTPSLALLRASKPSSASSKPTPCTTWRSVPATLFSDLKHLSAPGTQTGNVGVRTFCIVNTYSRLYLQTGPLPYVVLCRDGPCLAMLLGIRVARSGSTRSETMQLANIPAFWQ